MRAAITSGLKNSILFYAFSVGIMAAVHVVIGWENKALLPKSAIVMIFVALVAIPWALLNISNLICPVRRFRNAGELIVHAIFLGVLSMFLKM